jgi:hypothetical protein
VLGRPDMASSRDKRESVPMTLGNALAAHLRLIVWCKSCNHRAEPDLATQVAQHGSGMLVPDWARLLRCTECGERDADFVMSGGNQSKVRGRNRVTGNLSVRSRPLAPSQPPPRIAIAGDVPRGAASRRVRDVRLGRWAGANKKAGYSYERPAVLARKTRRGALLRCLRSASERDARGRST